MTLKSALDAVKTNVERLQEMYKSLNSSVIGLRKKLAAAGNNQMNDPEWADIPYDDEIYEELMDLRYKISSTQLS